MTGRPSTFTETIVETICERIADGQSLREICRSEGMPSKATVFRWLGENPGFQDRYARAKEAQADHFAEEILEIADDGSNDWMERKQGEETVTVADHEHISRSKLRVDARKWLMSKMLPKKYGDRVELEHSGLNAASDEQLDDRIRALTAALGTQEGTGGAS